MKVMITINTIVLMLLLVATRASAEVSRPYQVFNPSTMFDLFPTCFYPKNRQCFSQLRQQELWFCGWVDIKFYNKSTKTPCKFRK